MIHLSGILVLNRKLTSIIEICFSAVQSYSNDSRHEKPSTISQSQCCNSAKDGSGKDIVHSGTEIY